MTTDTERWTIVIEDDAGLTADHGTFETEDEAQGHAEALARATAEIHGWTVVTIGDGEWIECRESGSHSPTRRTYMIDIVGWQSETAEDFLDRLWTNTH